MRCPKCFGRIYSDETIVGHELSGRCKSKCTVPPRKKIVEKKVRVPKPGTPRKPVTRHIVECGTRAMYNRGCRCEPCKAAQLAWSREYRARPGNKERYDEYRSGWLVQNRDKVAEYRRKDNARKRALRKPS